MVVNCALHSSESRLAPMQRHACCIQAGLTHQKYSVNPVEGICGFNFGFTQACLWVKEVVKGSLGGAAVWRLPLAQGAILETWDRVPHQAPGAWSLLLPPPVSLPLSLSL